MRITQGFLLLVVVVTFIQIVAAAYPDDIQKVCYNQYQTAITETLNTASEIQTLKDTYHSKIEAVKRLQDTCESAVPVDCCQIKTLFPSAETGIYVMKDPCSGNKTFNSAKIHVRCDMETDGGGWIVIQRRIPQGTVNFTRNWDDYENGFGDLNTEFWIGLGNIYELTNNDEVDLIISVWNTIQTNITWRYPVFRIAGPTEKYRLTVSGGSGTSSYDAFGFHNNYYFTTHDRNNGGNNCGYQDQGGWWYNSCAFANLNGRHEPSGLPGVRRSEERLIWYSGNSKDVYTNSEMKIRSKSCGLS